MTVDVVGADLNGSISDLSTLKPTRSSSSSSSYTTGPSSIDKKDFQESAHTLATVECSESSWLGDYYGDASTNVSPIIRAVHASPKPRGLKKPGHGESGLKSLPETPDLDHSSSTHDDDDCSIKEILEAYLSKLANEEKRHASTSNDLDQTRIPARRPKLFRTPTPDPDGLYLEIRKAPRRYRKCRPEQVQAVRVLQGAVRGWLAQRQTKEAAADPRNNNNNNEEEEQEEEDTLRFLCRNKSFEGIMGDFLKKATPKRAVARHDEEVKELVLPQRGTLGASRSFDQHDFAQLLGTDMPAADSTEQPPRRRGGRRPGR